jgi:acetyltransferase-like isoleucine patch superfamily enzyme
MKIDTSDRLFFIIQAMLKYSTLPFMQKIRIFIYRYFFCHLGKDIIIKDGITFKFPSDITIKDGVKIAENCYCVGLGGLEIGKNTLIGAGTKIVTTNHNFESKEIDITYQGISSKRISIGANVWLGFNAVILSGSIIGDGSIIGANAVVTGIEVEKNSIMMGIPATLKKKR